MTEAEFQNQIIKYAQLKGWEVMHVRKATQGAKGRNRARWVTPTSVRGWPDLTLWHPKRGGMLFIEVKSDKGRVSPEQKAVLASLTDAGQYAVFAKPKMWEELKNLL